MTDYQNMNKTSMKDVQQQKNIQDSNRKYWAVWTPFNRYTLE